MQLIQNARDTSVPLGEKELSDLLSDRYYAIAQDRVNRVSKDELERSKEEARELAWDYAYAMFDLSSKDAALVVLGCRFFLIYTPEQLELVLSSPAAMLAIRKNRLMTDQELRDLAWTVVSARKNSTGDEEEGGFGGDGAGGSADSVIQEIDDRAGDGIEANRSDQDRGGCF